MFIDHIDASGYRQTASTALLYQFWSGCTTPSPHFMVLHALYLALIDAHRHCLQQAKPIPAQPITHGHCQQGTLAHQQLKPPNNDSGFSSADNKVGDHTARLISLDLQEEPQDSKCKELCNRQLPLHHFIVALASTFLLLLCVRFGHC